MVARLVRIILAFEASRDLLAKLGDSQSSVGLFERSVFWNNRNFEVRSLIRIFCINAMVTNSYIIIPLSS